MPPDEYEELKAKHGAGGTATADAASEYDFLRWYSGHASRFGLDPNPDAPAHKYDYRSAFRFGDEPDASGHWPSRWKADDHPNRFIDGVDTKSDAPSPVRPPGAFRGVASAAAPGGEVDNELPFSESLGDGSLTPRQAGLSPGEYQAERAMLESMSVGGRAMTEEEYYERTGRLPSPRKAVAYLRGREARDKRDADEVGLAGTIGRTLVAPLKGATFGFLDAEKIAGSPELSRLTDVYASERPLARLAPGIAEGAGAGIPIATGAQAVRGAFGIGKMSLGGRVAESALGMGVYEGIKEPPPGHSRLEAVVGGYAMGGVAAPVSRFVGGQKPGFVRDVASGFAGGFAGGIATGQSPEEAVESGAMVGGMHAVQGIGKMRAEAKTPKVELREGVELPQERALRERAEPTAAPDVPEIVAAAEPTSIKNRVVNQERAARGVSELPEPAKRAHEVANADAARIIETNPERPRELAREVAAKPRPLTDTDVMLLDRRRADLHKARKSADAEVIAAAERGDLDAVAAARGRVAEIGDEFLTLEQASKAGGTESARGLAARVRMMAEDYSLPAMETQRRVENDGARLTPKQAAETKVLHERLATALAERDAYRARLEARPPSGSSRKAPPLSPASKDYGATNRLVTRETYEATKAAIRAKLGGTTLRSGVDPTVIVDLAKVGAFHIEAGARRFATWAKAMTDDLGEEVRPHLRAAWNEARRNLPPDIRAEVDAPVLKGVKTRARNQIAELGARVEAGDFAPRERVPIHKDAEAVRLEARLDLAKKAWNEALFRDKMANRSKAQKAAAVPVEAANTARAIQTSLDFSAVFRQALPFTLAHPIRAARALPEMFASFRSADAQARSEAAIRMRGRYHEAKRAGVFFSEHGDVSLTKMEEAFTSRFVAKIPKLVGGGLVRGSQRAYTTFLNRVRMDMYDHLSSTLSRTGQATPAEAKAIANAVNVFTGRGGKMGESNTLAGLNTFIFSPRLIASRVQMLVGQPMYGGSARTRTLVVKEYARFLSGAATVYALAKLAGGEVETDARSSDFGKIRVGETRVDPMGGLLQYTTLVERVRAGQTAYEGKVRHADGTRLLGQFLRNKAAPVPGAVWSALTGKDPVYKPTSVGREALELIKPMSLDDIRKAMEEQGVARGTALGILSLFGMGLQTHEEKRK